MKTVYYIQNMTNNNLENYQTNNLAEAKATLRTYPPNYRIVVQYIVDAH